MNTTKSQSSAGRSHTRRTKGKNLPKSMSKSRIYIPSQTKDMVSLTDKQYIVRTFMEILTAIRIHHWSTTSYAQHKTTDDLYSKLEENIDRFIETLIGKNKKYPKIMSEHMQMFTFDTIGDIQASLFEFSEYLTSLCDVFDSKKDSDLLAIRDEMLADVNRHLYLLTMK
jgi:DNA-binding ferritin-like protein